VHETSVRLLEGLPAPGIEAKMVETATPKHGGLDLCLGIARHLEDDDFTQLESSLQKGWEGM